MLGCQSEYPIPQMEIVGPNAGKMCALKGTYIYLLSDLIPSEK